MSDHPNVEYYKRLAVWIGILVGCLLAWGLVVGVCWGVWLWVQR